jgi:flagellar protein FlgJ
MTAPLLNAAELFNKSEQLSPAAAMTQLSVRAHAKKMTDAEMDKTAQDFESMFLSQMMAPMFGDSTGESQFGNGDTKDIYKKMMLDEYGKSMAKSGGIGIASFVKKELLKMQEVAA